MGKYLTKTMMFLVLTPILLLHLSISSSFVGAEVKTNDENEVCIADHEFKKLNLCDLFNGKTCCSVSLMQTSSIATYGEADKDCLDMFELLECSCSFGKIQSDSESESLLGGIVCALFCDRVFEACSDFYFRTSNATTNQVIICGKASKWESNGTEFCDAMGFPFINVEEEETCYGSKPSLEPLMIESESSSDEKTESFAWFRDLENRVRDIEKTFRKMTPVQRMTWVVTTIVLVVMLFYKWRKLQQRLAIVQRHARRLT